MIAIDALLGSPLAQAIGWALVHLVWQGAVVAGLLAAALALLQRRSAQARYAVSCAALLLLLGLAAATAVRNYDAASDAPAAPAQIAAVFDSAAPQSPASPTVIEWTRAHLPKIVLFWIVGVAALSFRLAGGWLRAQRLARRSATPAAPEWQRAVARLSDSLGLRRGVALLHSAAVEVPTVLGWLRPMILLPMTLSGLSPEQIEMILAHELAHVRRHDFLVNLMQSVVETLLFYHPAVWWISARIRIEREHCCDDAAILIGGNALQYARALTRLEELRGDPTQLALAANGGSLLARIRRVAGMGGEGPSRWVAGAALLTVVAVLLAAPLLARDQAPTPPAPPPAPKAPAAVAATPAPPAAPAPPAHSTIVVHGNAESADAEVETPEPPEPPDPPEPPQARATTPRPPKPPRTPACPDAIDIHVAPMAMPKITIPPMDLHIEGIPGGIKGGIEGGIEGGIRGGIEGAMRESAAMRKMAIDMQRMSRSMALAYEPSQKYKESMRGAGLKMSDDEARQLYVMGVTPRYVQSLRDAGLRKLTAHDVIRLHAMGITAGFVKDLKRMQ